MWQGNDRFKGLDPVNSVPEELWVEVRNTVQEGKRTKPPQREGRARGTGSLRRPYKQLKEGEEGKAREKGKAHPTERRAPKSSTEGREGLLQRAPQETGRKQQKHKDRDSAGKRERGHLAKDRNGRELADAGEISKRWKELTYRSHSRETPKFTASLPVSPFTPPDRDRRVDSHAFSARVPDVPREPPDEAGLMRKFEK